MNFTRWYDRDERLKLVMETMEQLNDEVKLAIAVDLIQMIVDKRSSKLDNLIDELNKEYIPVRRRWHDRSETLHSAVEMLKLTSDSERPELVKEILYSIFHFTESDAPEKLNKEQK